MKTTWNRLASLGLIAFTTLTLHADTYYLQSLGGAGGPPYPFDPSDGTAPISEISSDQIGEQVMDALYALDPVAYVRFASVYRNFREVKDFEDFVGKLNVERE